ncbi:hypothetical protein TorRG33x02_065840 [Trema orientale]|uniref:Uncharacterized protein n=1 Tax=Trema orientale TaxID=63057 RepID=A0A2P5FIR9_TREOI|nr:hypothetical protein TorRG33x02_065840 [Trema orientale]
MTVAAVSPCTENAHKEKMNLQIGQKGNSLVITTSHISPQCGGTELESLDINSDIIAFG